MIKVQKKVLFCATVDYHFKAFHLPYMKWFQEQNWEVHVAANGEIDLPYCNVKYNVPIERTPFNTGNIEAYKELKRIISENGYDIIHVHTPVAGVLARLAARDARKKGTKVLYTVHGFHFFRGASVLNWMIYYPLERLLSHYTDGLITINEEDYKRAAKHKFKAKNIYRIHGVGVDLTKFTPINNEAKEELRGAYGYENGEFILSYVAELNKNKNQGLLLKAIARIGEDIPNIRLLLVGEGRLMEYYKTMAKELKVQDKVDFLGFRKDIAEIIKISDVAVASSFREGLPINVVEAMACGKPVIATDNRGHKELIKDNYNGYIISCNDEVTFGKRLCQLYYTKQFRECFAANTLIAAKAYSLQRVKEEMNKIYNENSTNERDINAVSNKGFTCSG